jgi:hypothetical protein
VRVIYSICFVLFGVWFVVATSQVLARTWTSSQLLDCGNGRYGTTCQEFRDIQLTWVAPTQYEDGAPLNPNHISHYVIRIQRDSSPMVYLRVGKKLSHTLRNRISGTYRFAIATVVKGRPQGAFTDSLTLEVN